MFQHSIAVLFLININTKYRVGQGGNRAHVTNDYATSRLSSHFVFDCLSTLCAWRWAGAGLDFRHILRFKYNTEAADVNKQLTLTLIICKHPPCILK